MFKYVVRRLRYGMAGKTIMLTKACISAVVLIVVFFIIFSGAFSQKKMFLGLFRTFWSTSEDMSGKIKDGDTGPLQLTDEGVYIKGHENGNKIDLGGESSNDKTNSDNKDEESEANKKEDKEGSDKDKEDKTNK